MLKVVISGWYGFGNIGDEVILQSMIDSIREKWADADITVLSYNSLYTESVQSVKAVSQISIKPRHPFLLLIELIKKFRTLNAIAKCDVFILGGGGFLSDWQPEVPKGWLKQLQLAKLFKKKTMLYGIGAGPFISREGKNTTAYYINNFADVVTVRDKISLEKLQDAGVKKELLSLTADPVYNFNLTKLDLDDSKTFCVYLSFPNMFYSDLWANNEENRERYIKSIKALTDSLSHKNIEYKFVSFMRGKDEDFIFSEFGEESVVIDNIVDLHNCFKDKKPIVLGLRFHFNILALKLNVPVIPVVYHHKVFSLVRDFDVKYLEVGNGENWTHCTLDPKKALALVDYISLNYNEEKLKIESRMLDMQVRGRLNIALLEKLL